ncbi:hypothetical protein FBEOM_1113 [Fusarium beomiforme]|uniref:Uncharacterized protein n=1 Tax=Fusarium beomiforme TaxID=44412 RepID=A0A9P5AW38_9HYPO|nr:hypothetical protein FBEOM_1113 [Fusarium beomiforme]
MSENIIRFTPCSHQNHPSKDIEYRRLFSEPLTKTGGTISYGGYLRALQLYGREDQLINSHKVHRYDSTSANTDGIAPPRRTPCDSSGRFTPSDDAFVYHGGNIKVKAGQSARDAIGAAENALLLAEVVKNFINSGVIPALREKASSILTSRPCSEPASGQIGSAIGAAYHSGGTGNARGTFNDTPIPIDLTDSPSARKRRATVTTDPDSDEELLAIFDRPLGQTPDALAVIARPWPAMPYIIADSITVGNGRPQGHLFTQRR